MDNVYNCLLLITRLLPGPGYHHLSPSSLKPCSPLHVSAFKFNQGSGYQGSVFFGKG